MTTTKLATAAALAEPTAGPPVLPSARAMIEAWRPSDPIFCIHPSRLARVVTRFLDGFPGSVLYAVKANPHPEIVREIYRAGVRHFDTASIREIELVRDLSTASGAVTTTARPATGYIWTFAQASRPRAGSMNAIHDILTSRRKRSARS